jgi:hypothetical protein
MRSLIHNNPISFIIIIKPQDEQDPLTLFHLFFFFELEKRKKEMDCARWEWIK